MLKLIADAGSTKIEWVVVENKKVVKRLITSGYNPNYARPIAFIDILYKEMKHFPAVDAVYYYGSGCGSAFAQSETRQYLKVRFEEANEVVVTHDLMGAAHALLDHKKGIACILGTGANACCYDGEDITNRAVSLGYLVGDEGSGCYIGRKLVRSYFYNLMPNDLQALFKEEVQLDYASFLDHVYRQPEPSKYLASFTHFAGKHQDHPFIHQLVSDAFDDFIEVFLLPFDGCHELPIGFVGSVAFHFKDILRERLEVHGLHLDTVMVSPMEGLIQRYS